MTATAQLQGEEGVVLSCRGGVQSEGAAFVPQPQLKVNLQGIAVLMFTFGFTFYGHHQSEPETDATVTPSNWSTIESVKGNLKHRSMSLSGGDCFEWSRDLS